MGMIDCLVGTAPGSALDAIRARRPEARTHARFAATYSKRAGDVQRLSDDGVGADLGKRWYAIAAAP